MKQENVTIETIAAVCGVSCGTVSRAISRPEMVAPGTREKILAAVKEYNYVPNPVARAMSGKRGKTISIVVPDIEFTYQSEVVRGCSEELYKQGYTLLVMDNSVYHKRTTDYIAVLRQQICNGVIFCFENNDESMHAILPGQPIVSFEFPSPSEGIHSVVTDLEYGCGELVSFLHVLNGHSRIALAAGREGDYITGQVVQGYRRVMERFSLPVREEYICLCDWSLQQGFESAKYFLSLTERPTAVIYYSSSMAQGALTAFHEYGVSLPGEMSLVTMDGTRSNRYLVPGLTTLNYDVEEIGRTLANTMIAALKRQPLPARPNVIRASGVRTGRSVLPAGR